MSQLYFELCGARSQILSTWKLGKINIQVQAFFDKITGKVYLYDTSGILDEICKPEEVVSYSIIEETNVNLELDQDSQHWVRRYSI